MDKRFNFNGFNNEDEGYLSEQDGIEVDDDYNEGEIVFTNGVFDLLHLGHIRFLQKARSLGDYLIVGINSDSSVKRLKGKHRPFLSEIERKEMLLALDCVDEVVLFGENTAVDLLEKIQPDIYVKSDEYMNVKLPEFTTAYKLGTKIAIVQPAEDLRNVKTSNIVEKIYQTELKRRSEV